MLIYANGDRLPPGWWELEEAENMDFLHDLKDILAEHTKLGYPEIYYQQASYAKKIMERTEEHAKKLQSYKEMETKWKESHQ